MDLGLFGKIAVWKMKRKLATDLWKGNTDAAMDGVLILKMLEGK